MRVDNHGRVFILGDIALKRDQFLGIRDVLRNVACPVPIPDFGIPHHADSQEQECRIHTQSSNRIHQIVAVLQPNNPFLFRMCLDHDAPILAAFQDAYQTHRQLLGKTLASILHPMMEADSQVLWVAERLLGRFGASMPSLDDPALETLVLTILSQNTNDTNRDRAYASLLSEFGGFEAVRTAPTDAVAEAIKIGGLNQQKARSIQAALNRILEEQKSLSLDFLQALPKAEALAWLLDLPGVGPKTAGIVLLFSFGVPYFPVDTHIRRVMTRVGVLETGDDSHDVLNRRLPEDAELLAMLHVQAIQLGRRYCHPKRPECEQCPLMDGCAWAAKHASQDEGASSS